MDKKEHDKKIKELEERSYGGILEYPDIIEELDKLLEENPNDIEALNFKADMLRQLGHETDAKCISAKILSLNFKDKEALQEFLDMECEGIKLSTPAILWIIFAFVLINALFFVVINNIQVPDVIYNNVFILPVVSFVASPVTIVVVNWGSALKRCNQKIPGFAKQYLKNAFFNDDIATAVAFFVSVVIGFVVASLIDAPYSGTVGTFAGIAVYAIWAYLAITAEDRAKKKKRKRKLRKSE